MNVLFHMTIFIIKRCNMNNDKLYELVKTLRKYATSLVNLNPNYAIKLDSSDWQSCILDIATSLAVIEILIKNGKDE